MKSKILHRILINLTFIFCFVFTITIWLLSDYSDNQLDLAVERYFRNSSQTALKLENTFEKKVEEIQNFIMQNLDPVMKKLTRPVPKKWFRSIPKDSNLSQAEIQSYWSSEYVKEFNLSLKQRNLFSLKKFRDKILDKFPQLNEKNMEVEYLDLHLVWHRLKALQFEEDLSTFDTNRLTIVLNPVDQGLVTGFISKIFVDLLAKHMMGNLRIKYYFLDPFEEMVGIQFDPSSKNFQSINIKRMGIDEELMFLGVIMPPQSQEFLIREDLLANLIPEQRYQGFLSCALKLKSLLYELMLQYKKHLEQDTLAQKHLRDGDFKKYLEYDAVDQKNLLDGNLTTKYHQFFQLDSITHKEVKELKATELEEALEKASGNLKLIALNHSKQKYFINLVRDSRYKNYVQIFQTSRAQLLAPAKRVIRNIQFAFGGLLLFVILVAVLFAGGLTKTLRKLTVLVQEASSSLQSNELVNLKTNIIELSILRSFFVNQTDQLRKEFEISAKLTNFQEFLIHRPNEDQIHNYLKPIFAEMFEVNVTETLEEKLPIMFDLAKQNIVDTSETANEFQWELQRYYESLKLEKDFRYATQQKQEFELAQRIQKQLLPPQDSCNNNLHYYYLAARYLGGDFYDLLQIGHKTYYLIADVSGKGLPSALFGAATKFFLSNQLKTDQKLEDAIQSTNLYLCGLQQQGFFCTLFLACWDAQTRTLEYCSAGHNKMYLLTPDLIELNAKGLPLGFMDISKYSSVTMNNVPMGSLLALYTDGVTEAENTLKHLYDNPRLEEILRENFEREPAEISEALLKSLTDFTEGAEQSDDITYLFARL